MTAEFLAHSLKARKVGSTWMALCPGYEDRNPSLAIREEGGKVLVHCFAGCSQCDVVEALKARGLWESTNQTKWAKRIVATYDYTDQQGQFLYQIVRFEPKDFRPRYPDGRGGWTWKKHPRQVLYRLPEVCSGGRVRTRDTAGPCPPASVNRELATLRRMLRLAQEWKVIDRVPRIRMLEG